MRNDAKLFYIFLYEFLDFLSSIFFLLVGLVDDGISNILVFAPACPLAFCPTYRSRDLVSLCTICMAHTPKMHQSTVGSHPNLNNR